MNLLAHFYLSGTDESLLLGNFMADFVKGRLDRLPTDFFPPHADRPGLLRGIRLHRYIDHFTDTHPTVRASKQRLRAAHRHYAGVVTDVYYDHFLAAHWPDYHPLPLPDFAARIYATVLRQQAVLPPAMAPLVRHLTTHDWLGSYAEVAGIERALAGLARRTAFASGMEHAGLSLRQHYAAFDEEFCIFFPQLVAATAAFLATEGE